MKNVRNQTWLKLMARGFGRSAGEQESIKAQCLGWMRRKGVSHPEAIAHMQARGAKAIAHPVRPPGLTASRSQRHPESFLGSRPLTDASALDKRARRGLQCAFSGVYDLHSFIIV